MSSRKRRVDNIAPYVPGHSRNLADLRTKSLKALKKWETAQKAPFRSKNNELQLKKNAANALAKYSNAIVDDAEKTVYIGTAQNMTGNAPLFVGHRGGRRRSRKNRRR